MGRGSSGGDPRTSGDDRRRSREALREIMETPERITITEASSMIIITTGDGHPLQGGIQDTTIELPEGTPSLYGVFYVQVDDVEAACSKVFNLGGKVLVPATTIPTGLVYAHVSDPVGNHFALFTPPAQP